jgi:hypothetical protein
MFLSNLLTGHARRAKRRTRHSSSRSRQLRCEKLEERQLLSAVHTFANNTPTAIKDTGTINSKTTSTMNLPAGYLRCAG